MVHRHSPATKPQCFDRPNGVYSLSSQSMSSSLTKTEHVLTRDTGGVVPLELVERAIAQTSAFQRELEQRKQLWKSLNTALPQAGVWAYCRSGIPTASSVD